MNMDEIIGKIGEEKLRAAMESDDASALMALFQEEGIEITEEQLDYIAGGMATGFYYDKNGRKIEFTSDGSCLIPGLSCLPDNYKLYSEWFLDDRVPFKGSGWVG